MIDKETLKQFENIDFDVVIEYLPDRSELLKHLNSIDWEYVDYDSIETNV